MTQHFPARGCSDCEEKGARADRCATGSLAAVASLTIIVRKFICAASRADDSQQTFVATPVMSTVSHPRPRSRCARSEPSGMKALNRCFSIRSEEHTSELQSLMRISYAVFCLKKTKKHI